MQLGKINRLTVSKQTEEGYLLEDKETKGILLPLDDSATEIVLGMSLEVFVYKDNGNQVMATTKKPTIEFEKFAYLQVKDVNTVGAFMDWGISKDLLVPYAEQTEDLHKGDWQLIFMLLDKETDRLIGSCKVDEFVFYDEIDVKIGDAVDLLIYGKSDLGYNAIVNNLYKGLIFNSDIHKEIKSGDTIKGYVKQVREDGKLDIVLEPLGYKKSINTSTSIILNYLQTHNGCLYLTDKSSPETIKQQLGLSKKAFKRGLGSLYKQHTIEILEDRIRLL